MTSDNFTEHLIESVRNYPLLYDTAHVDYKNNRIKNKIWDNIAENLRESDGNTLKNKWKNLRDAYSKHLRSNKTHTGQAAKLVDRYKTWPWVEQMCFLRPYLEFASTHSNVTQASTSLASTETLINTPSHQHSRRISKQNETQVDKVINYLNTRNNADFDDIDLVFLGYAKTLKKMTKSRQARIKFQFAKIIMESELEEAEESSLTAHLRTLQSPENDNIFTESTPVNSPDECTNDSVQDYEYIVSSPPEPTANTSIVNVIQSSAHSRNTSLLNTDPLSQQSSFIIHSHEEIDLPNVKIFPATHTQNQQPKYVDPRQYTIASTKAYYEKFGKK